MAGNYYENALWVSQGDPALVNEQVTEPGQNPDPGATKQFVAGQVGKRINLTDPTNSGALVAKEYQYVERSDSTTLNAVPCILQWVDPSVDFKVELADGSGAIAGVFLGDDTATTGLSGMQDGNFGFVGVGGEFEVYAGGVCTAGSDLTTTSNGLAIDRTAFSEPLLGICLESGTTNDTIPVLLSLANID